MATSIGLTPKTITAEDFLNVLITFIPFTYLAHWNTSRDVEHRAMETSQDEYPALLDVLIEAYQGKTDSRPKFVSAHITSGSIQTEITTLLRYIKAHRKEALGEDSSLQNVVDEIVGHLNQTLDRVRRQ